MAFFLVEDLVPMLLNNSSIWASDIPADGEGGNVRQVFLNPFESFRNFLRCLVVLEVMLDEYLQISIQRDLFALLPVSTHPYVVEVGCVFSIILSSFPFLLKFVPDTALWAVERLRNFLE